jgi:hypothetical protein
MLLVGCARRRCRRRGRLDGGEGSRGRSSIGMPLREPRRAFSWTSGEFRLVNGTLAEAEAVSAAMHVAARGVLGERRKRCGQGRVVSPYRGQASAVSHDAATIPQSCGGPAPLDRRPRHGPCGVAWPRHLMRIRGIGAFCLMDASRPERLPHSCRVFGGHSRDGRNRGVNEPSLRKVGRLYEGRLEKASTDWGTGGVERGRH